MLFVDQQQIRFGDRTYCRYFTGDLTMTHYRVSVSSIPFASTQYQLALYCF